MVAHVRTCVFLVFPRLDLAIILLLVLYFFKCLFVGALRSIMISTSLYLCFNPVCTLHPVTLHVRRQHMLQTHQRPRSCGVFVAVNCNLGTVVGEKEGAVASIPGNEGKIAQAWVKVQGGLRVFSVYFWHSEGWTPKNEALLEAGVLRARVTQTSLAGGM